MLIEIRQKKYKNQESILKTNKKLKSNVIDSRNSKNRLISSIKLQNSLKDKIKLFTQQMNNFPFLTTIRSQESPLLRLASFKASHQSEWVQDSDLEREIKNKSIKTIRLMKVVSILIHPNELQFFKRLFEIHASWIIKI